MGLQLLARVTASGGCGSKSVAAQLSEKDAPGAARASVGKAQTADARMTLANLMKISFQYEQVSAASIM